MEPSQFLAGIYFIPGNKLCARPFLIPSGSCRGKENRGHIHQKHIFTAVSSFPPLSTWDILLPHWSPHDEMSANGLSWGSYLPHYICKSSDHGLALILNVMLGTQGFHQGSHLVKIVTRHGWKKTVEREEKLTRGQSRRYFCNMDPAVITALAISGHTGRFIQEIIFHLPGSQRVLDRDEPAKVLWIIAEPRSFLMRPFVLGY